MALLTAGLTACGISAVRAAEPVAGTETSRAQSIAIALEKGRTEEALIAARAAALTYPMSGLIQRRLAQACLAEYAETVTTQSNHLVEVQYATLLDQANGRLTDWISGPRPYPNAKTREQLKQLQEVIAGPAGKQLRDRAAQVLPEVTATLPKRANLLRDASTAAQEAQRLDGANSEASLTALWTDVMVLLWRGEETWFLERTQSPAGKAPANGASGPTIRPSVDDYLKASRRTLAAFSMVTPEAVLTRAARLAEEQKNDPIAVAGAADVLHTVGRITHAPFKLTGFARAQLEHAYRSRDAAPITPFADDRNAAVQAYRNALGDTPPDPVKAPEAASLRLYDHAFQLPGASRLPYLTERVYLWRAAFAPEDATPLLEQMARREPNNAVLELERARAAYSQQRDAEAMLRHFRAAALTRSFSRSQLVALPAVLRPSFRTHPGLQAALRDGWPVFHWVFASLNNPTALADDVGVRMEMRLLRLHLADRFCDATDWEDQAEGIHEKTLALRDLAEVADALPADQRALIAQEQALHARAYSRSAVDATTMTITSSGIQLNGFPAVASDADTDEGPHVILNTTGGVLLFAFVKHYKSKP